MDKKAKKRTEVLRTAHQQPSPTIGRGRKQMDDPDEVKNLEKQLAAAEAELAKLKE